MILETDFADFLQDIRPTKAMREDLRTGHQNLRDRLNADEGLKKCLVSDFLQGSYKRSTAIRPKGDRRSDVDIIVVTKLSEEEYTPAKAMDVFKPFLDKHYKGKWRQQGRSFGIELSYVELDLVLTSAPSEAEAGILRSEALSSDARVSHVSYPGLSSHPEHAIARDQMTGFGGMVSVRLRGGEQAARELCSRTEIFILAESLGGVESLIEHPGAMTHASTAGSQLEVPNDLVRLSVGIEDIADLIGDLEQALG